MGVKTLVLHFEYRPDLVVQFEDPSKVMLLAYLTEDLGHHYDVRIPGKDVHSFKLDMQVPDDLSKPFIAADSAVIVRAFAAGLNDDGQKVMKQVGSTFFYISELLSDSASQRKVGPKNVVIPNLENPITGEVPIKGSLALVVEPMPELANAVKPVGPHDFVPANFPAYEKMLLQYQLGVRVPYNELRPTFANATGLCMPIVASGMVKLPGALFAYPRSARSVPEWHYNAFLAATRRAYPHLESKAEVVAFLSSSQLNDTEIMNIVMLSHTAVVANGTCYVGDGAYVKTDRMVQTSEAVVGLSLGAFPPDSPAKAKLSEMRRPICGSCMRTASRLNASLHSNVEYRGMEDFAVGVCRMMKNIKDWGCLGAIDCEDGGMDAMIQAMDLRYCEFPNHPIMQRVKRAIMSYEPNQSLEYVNGRELADAEHTNRLGGHMKSMYVARDYQVQMQERGSTARPVFDRQMSQSTVAASPKDPVAVLVIDGEGTGLMMPVPNDDLADRMLATHSYLQIFTEATAESMVGARYMMPHHESKKSRFYNTISSYVPLSLADERFPAIEHLAIKQGPKGMTIGIDYLDFINGSKTNSTFINGRMTEEQAPYMMNLLKFMAPIPAYQTAPDVADSHPLLDRLVQAATQQNRKQLSGPTQYYQVYFREHDVRPSAISVLLNRIQSKQRVFRVSYHHENFGQDVSSWCVQFHLNP